MRYFYGRVSAKDQNLARQIDIADGYDMVFMDKKSGKDFERKEYKRMFKMLKEGDTLVVKSIDRFGRNYDLMAREIQKLNDLGVKLEVIDMPFLNTTDDLMSRVISDITIKLLSFVAQQELDNIHQRQKEGIESAKKKGVKFGRPKLEVIEPKPENETVSEYCKRVGISRNTYYRNFA